MSPAKHDWVISEEMKKLNIEVEKEKGGRLMTEEEVQRCDRMMSRRNQRGKGVGRVHACLNT